MHGIMLMYERTSETWTSHLPFKIMSYEYGINRCSTPQLLYRDRIFNSVFAG